MSSNGPETSGPGDDQAAPEESAAGHDLGPAVEDREDVDARLDDGLNGEDDAAWVLFDGDQGRLNLAQRKALVAVLHHRFITAQSKPKEWRALIANPRLIESRLNDMFLELHIDPAREVAYKRQVTAEGEPSQFPTLLYDTPYTREETVVLVYLRSRYLAEQMEGTAGRVLIDADDIVEHARNYRPASHTDLTVADAKTRRAIENLRTAGLLVKTTDTDRFEISRAIEVLLSMDTLERLLAWLKTSNGQTPTADPEEQS